MTAERIKSETDFAQDELRTLLVWQKTLLQELAKEAADEAGRQETIPCLTWILQKAGQLKEAEAEIAQLQKKIKLLAYLVRA